MVDGVGMIGFRFLGMASRIWDEHLCGMAFARLHGARMDVFPLLDLATKVGLE